LDWAPLQHPPGFSQGITALCGQSRDDPGGKDQSGADTDSMVTQIRLSSLNQQITRRAAALRSATNRTWIIASVVLACRVIDQIRCRLGRCPRVSDPAKLTRKAKAVGYHSLAETLLATTIYPCRSICICFIRRCFFTFGFSFSLRAVLFVALREDHNATERMKKV
jgi:hypothetical protein